MFSDLVNGPSVGLEDGKGSGVVVTIWGQNLGSVKGDGRVVFKDSSGKEYEPHIYYWKNADGKLPSGPADLFSSHKAQEIAFSIPAAANGAGEILVEKGGIRSQPLPFLVREGKIFHVKSSGSDSGDGSWNNPWKTVGKADATAEAGSTIYIHDVDTGNMSNPQARGIYWNNTNSSSSAGAHFAILAYPGNQPKVIAQKAVENYKTEGMVVAKLDVYASNYLSVDEHGQPVGSPIESSPGDTYGIQTTKFGRVIANRIGDIEGGCASKWNGAINGGYGRVEAVKLYGNEIYDYGCNGSSKLHHTTYLSLRGSDQPIVEPWEWAYNYLHGNKAKFGIHNYDQGSGCGDLSDTLIIRDNVIIDQAGAGINVGSSCGWSMDGAIYNNLLVNVGLPADWDGVDPNTSQGPENGAIALRDQGDKSSGGGLSGHYRIFNNTIYRWTEDDQRQGGRGCLSFHGFGDNVSVNFSNNICITEIDRPFIGATTASENKLNNVVGSNNVFYYSGSAEPVEAVKPIWDASALTSDPKLRFYDDRVEVLTDSPVAQNGNNLDLKYDLYGNKRPITRPAIGAVEVAGSPPSVPSDISIQ
ncbi:hypothetical protein MSSD14B_38200 [Marinobacter salsuginis]|uniref:Right handed beta helix domain-containing protein n=2 Tax=Marinobacter salsuginis TaxID=418719 RepID=A0A5M3Q4M3_9GAMM|nr:hypothetical protein MSSD14B_38200 [Marinobacter salsuginis]